MRAEQWYFIAFTGILFLGLLCFAVFSAAHGRGYRWLGRLFFAAAALWISESLGGVALNGLTLPIIVGLGLPGYAALAVIKLL